MLHPVGLVLDVVDIAQIGVEPVDRLFIEHVAGILRREAVHLVGIRHPVVSGSSRSLGRSEVEVNAREQRLRRNLVGTPLHLVHRQQADGVFQFADDEGVNVLNRGEIPESVRGRGDGLGADGHAAVVDDQHEMIEGTQKMSFAEDFVTRRGRNIGHLRNVVQHRIGAGEAHVGRFEKVDRLVAGRRNVPLEQRTLVGLAVGFVLVGRHIAQIKEEASAVVYIVQGHIGIHQRRFGIGLGIVEGLVGIGAVGDFVETRAHPRERSQQCEIQEYPFHVHLAFG